MKSQACEKILLLEYRDNNIERFTDDSRNAELGSVIFPSINRPFFPIDMGGFL